ncbi:cytochrome c oxidase subunit 7A1, mitochondrial [Drosophila serrata]|uniref:cytochrome c oxidase subunit 7A1, mitochondrial n=1 Tax=Drosophila serrata TaxID=7274 RepID=UPI000A1D246F|nr:cytochrome c oxidase subunit 7A1, mitochondrial [Drosophila serrata]
MGISYIRAKSKYGPARRIVQQNEGFPGSNELPVFLKGGPADKILFGITAGLCGVGIISFVHLVYTMGFAKKKA